MWKALIVQSNLTGLCCFIWKITKLDCIYVSVRLHLSIKILRHCSFCWFTLCLDTVRIILSPKCPDCVALRWESISVILSATVYMWMDLFRDLYFLFLSCLRQQSVSSIPCAFLQILNMRVVIADFSFVFSQIGHWDIDLAETRPD